MRTLSVISFCFVLSCQTAGKRDEVPGSSEASAVTPSPTAASEEEGDKAWANRQDKDSLMAAIRLWTEASDAEPNALLWVKLSRAHYLFADAFLFDDEAETRVERKEHFAEGYGAAEKSLQMSSPEYFDLKSKGVALKEALLEAGPDSTSALYWYSVNVGKWSRAEGPLWIMRHKDEVRSNMERVRRLDATFFYAAPERYFGALEAATQGLLGGSLAKSDESFERAISLAPEYLGNKVVYAEFGAVKKKDRALFERLLQEVISADAAACEECAPENLLEQQKAQRLLSQVEVLF